MNVTETLENVVLLGGQKKNPIYLNPFILLVHLICCIFGIPLNAFIAGFILHKQRLRTKPRNIFLLGLTLTNLSAFVPILIELTYFHFPQNDELCQIYVAIVGLPFVLFLSNLLLALIDRYSAITHPIWHRKKVTVRWAASWQIFVTVSVAVGYKFVYITRLVDLECEINLVQVRVLSIMLVVLFSACIIAQIIVYRQTKRILSNYVTTTSSGRRNQIRTNRTRDLAIDEAPIDIDFANHEGSAEHPSQQQNQSLTSRNSAINASESTRVHFQHNMTEQSVSLLEIEATRTMIASVTSLSILTGPFILFSLTTFTCRLCCDKFVCSSISWLSPYFKLLLVLYAVYHPLTQLFRKTEISSALKDWLNR